MSHSRVPTARCGYLDTLRAVAILRVFLHHTLWIGWLAVIFPSMSIMFALAGYLTAASLDRGGAARTILSRLRRLLPPLWVLALVAVPVMLAHGWLSDEERPLRWPDLTWWVLPLANPPASLWGEWFALALWYLRAYLWLVLVSPALWWAFRRWPVATLLTPLTVAALLYSPLVIVPENPVGHALWSTALYGTCWLLGFARHTRLLDRVPVWGCAAIAVGLCGAGLLWAAIETRAVAALQTVPLDPLANMLWGTGFALVLMRLRPAMTWLERTPRLVRVVRMVNARAITIYIWHLPALFATAGLVLLAGVDAVSPAGIATTLFVGSLLTAAAVLSVGWVEDLAARRRPVILPLRPGPGASS